MRKILFITGSRGEYGYIRPILKIINKTPGIDYEIVATNMHLLPEFGYSVKAFKEDGFEVKYSTLNTLAGYTPSSMMKSLSLFGLSIIDILAQSNPDIILLAGDRGEQFMGAMAGAHLNIPVAHIQAGEVSGNVDGLTRHALARYAHIHFAANEDAAVRLERTGEQVERIHNVGAPQLDEFVNGDVTPKKTLNELYNFDVGQEYILIVQHPVTEEYLKSGEQMRNTIEAIKNIDLPAILIAPNSDAGSVAVQQAIESYTGLKVSVHRNVKREDYAGFLATASVIVGNSSSGLLEAPTFGLPCVNIGRRQIGRMQGRNVINCGHEVGDICEAIKSALSPNFRKNLEGIENPYGDGKSSERIVKILKNIDIDEKLLTKSLTY
ncbi:UDP-N-acetylglucosamine 2-epimerase [Pseudomonadales bacterium]|nr:UDP-N-acetylglucosamine 2-epimerase [Pseudomonadales bacterium]